MCGICGFWHVGYSAPMAEMAGKMAGQISSRGPDDQGVWVNKQAGLALAHRRLSIIDLSAEGKQPMTSPCGRYTLIFNGEIYNHQDIRQELENTNDHLQWRGHSDTETLLAALHHWGLEPTLKKLNGMFAFAFWDDQDHTLFIARDRMGEKPLYYGRSGNCLLFASELKALTVHSDWQGKVNRGALALYMRHSYVPAPYSIYEGIFKLPPAHFVVIRDGGRDVQKPQCYWDLGNVAERGVVAASDDTDNLINSLETLLSDAVSLRMASDVPLGAFLSGGYDSTIIAALMQALSHSPIKTFTIGFNEEGYDEATHAKAVAQHLGTDHTELYVTPEQAMAVIPQLPTMYDEPFADSSQIPTFLVSQLARKDVTVSLSGDGGDELFCGYNRYLLGYKIWQKLSVLPTPVKSVLSQLCARAPGHTLDAIQRRLPAKMRVSNLADRLPKLAEVLAHKSGYSFYRDLVSHSKTPEQLVIGATEPETFLSSPHLMPNLGGLQEQMMYMDMKTYLPDDILTKVDRASMAVSLEARVPMLDHRLVEFAWNVPSSLKCYKGEGKWLLKQVLYRYVPKSLMDRPKMGFGVPIEHWLRGPLREWAESLLNEQRLRDEGYFHPEPIRKMWADHISERRGWHYHLWDVLMFQAWLDSQNHNKLSL